MLLYPNLACVALDAGMRIGQKCFNIKGRIYPILNQFSLDFHEMNKEDYDKLVASQTTN